MKTSSLPILLILLISLLFAGCSELNSQDDYEEFFVVESYLTAQRNLPPVLLSTTSPAFAEYNFEEVAVEDAQIQVHLLEEGPESDVEETFLYEQLDPGIYATRTSHQVLPTRTYRLNVTLPGNAGAMEAFTTIPDTFQVVESARTDTVVYQSNEQLEITVTPSEYSGRQNVYVFNTVALDTTELTPFYADQVDDEEDLVDLRNTDSGLINEENFQVNEDGTITLRYPWIGVAFYGDNLIIANTIDDNIYDFLRSQSVQLGGTTLSPGEIQNAIYHVDGGIGVFGSFASDTVQTHILPQN